ncbi:YkvA family protein [Marinicella rhabdoformis]|uniref:YkvA family protein n=1 Tax=Marinicella rhabdoformis TaxID=2580566 RepID=UPI0012AEDDD0|nr:YkvA family protein [Marinicella rhabdoformis]
MATISIDIDDQVKEHFNKFIEEHGSNIDAGDVKEAKEKIVEIRNSCDDGYVVDQVGCLQMMLSMVEDKTWKVSEANKEKINATIRYFVDDNDVIPDHIPGIGYVDDCIVIDGTMDDAEEEMLEYKDFCRARMVYAKNGPFTLDDWGKIKDQEAVSRVRNRRYRKSKRSRGW